MLVNTHYKMPWIIWRTTYSLSVASGGYIADQTLAHGLGFTPLLLGQWSDTSDFSPSYDLAVTVPGGLIGGQPETVCAVTADASMVHFEIVNNATRRRTFYFRLMAFAPPGHTGDVNPVAYESPFRFNSHYRYQQIYRQGQASSTVYHNLGYLPQARVWSISGSRVVPFMGIITEQSLKCAADGSYYYHIYKDKL